MIRAIGDYILSRDLSLKLQTGIIRKMNPQAIFGEWWISPMGGQARRVKKVIELMDEFNPDLIIETGTFIGTTTPLLATLFEKPVITIELNARLAKRNRLMFSKLHPSLEITQVIGNSDTELSAILKQMDKGVKLFAYLDAHWFDYLPTTKELESLAKWGGDFIALIDDFKNDYDSGYGFDEYKSGQHIGKHLIPVGLGLRLFVPAVKSSKEGLGKRGTAYVLSKDLVEKYEFDLSDLKEIDLE